MRLLPPNRRTRAIIQKQPLTILAPIHLVRHEESIRMNMHTQRHILPIGRIHLVLGRKPPRVGVISRRVGRLVEYPHGTELEQFRRRGVRVRFDVDARFENGLGDVAPFLVDHDLDDLSHGDGREGFGGGLAGGVDAGVDGVAVGLHAYHLDDDGVADVLVLGALPEVGFGLGFAVMAVGSIAAVAVMAIVIVAVVVVAIVFVGR
mmetsp:Transcript_11342/g.24194  ORF Transcript_11342/g.24194 Transcript_11342/m.24194 type:complete len:205 (+) Transcript_11342:819-1433(+)